MVALAKDSIAVNKDMTASGLVGRSLLDKDGIKWQDGPLTAVVRLGAIRNLDEVVMESWRIPMSLLLSSFGIILKRQLKNCISAVSSYTA